MTATAAHVQGFFKGWKKDWVAGRAFKVVFQYQKDISSGYKAAFQVKNKSGTSLATAFANGSTTNAITIGSYNSSTGRTEITIDIKSTVIPSTTAAQTADCELILYSSTTAANYFPLLIGEIMIHNDIVTTTG